MDTGEAVSLVQESRLLLKTAWEAIRDTKLVGQFLPPSVDAFSQFRLLQKQRRRVFADVAARLPRYRDGLNTFRHSSLLAQSDWILSSPILLIPPKDDLSDDGGQFVTTYGEESADRYLIGDHQTPEVASRIRQLLPPVDGKPAETLSQAILAIEKPNLQRFQSRPSYSLTRFSLDPAAGAKLWFRKAYYFDYINCGELLALELIREFRFVGDSDKLRILDPDPTSAVTHDVYKALDDRLKLRSLLGDWFVTRRRPSLAGVNMLTVFLDPESGLATFPMMKRSTLAGSAAGTVHVIPAGEFQPTSDARPDWEKHCTLWQTILRETAEELLNHPEAESHSKQMEELAILEPIVSMLRMIRNGQWKAYFLGIGLDPLTLKPEILVVSVINLREFRSSFSAYLPDGRLPREDSEGDIHRTGGGWGSPLTAKNLRIYRDDPDALPAASGCIELFLRVAPSILGHAFPE